jgi:phosphoribosyl 1,2-cyclic phosphodiesterase
VKVRFYGVRGSYPCPGTECTRYGGNTACVAVDVAGEPPILFDMGTGMVAFGASQPLDGTFRASALVSHAHWDHIQGLPFFAPINRPGAVLDVYGPGDEGLSLTEIFDRYVAPPVFPISWRDLAGTIRLHETSPGTISVGSCRVRVCSVPHPGSTLGYRVEADGVAVAYVSDHQMPRDRCSVDPAVSELCEGVDLLVHDAQYTDSEFDAKPDWGHSTIGYAIEVARSCGAGRLALFHHDPSHDDLRLDDLAAAAREAGNELGLAVFAAREGDVVDLGEAAAG